MSLDSFIYLVETYWLFIAGAAAVGVVTGWLSVSPGKG